MSTYRITCKAHGATFATSADLNALYDAQLMSGKPVTTGYGACRKCGRLQVAESVATKKGKRACGSWCTEGTGKSCTCECYDGHTHFDHTGPCLACGQK